MIEIDFGSAVPRLEEMFEKENALAAEFFGKKQQARRASSERQSPDAARQHKRDNSRPTQGLASQHEASIEYNAKESVLLTTVCQQSLPKAGRAGSTAAITPPTKQNNENSKNNKFPKPVEYVLLALRL